MIARRLLKNPFIVALDVDTKEQALALVDDLADLAGGFKLGPRLLLRYGEGLVDHIARHSPVFVDCKFFDIPSTMESAVRTSFHAGATLVTVHALAGAEALARMARVEQELAAIRPFRILVVTVLTSFSEQNLPPVLQRIPINEHVKLLAAMSLQEGLSGLVCSAEELPLLDPSQHFIVTPGIRLPGADHQDQSRVVTPDVAIAQGASALVVGRPVIQARVPREALRAFGRSAGINL